MVVSTSEPDSWAGWYKQYRDALIKAETALATQVEIIKGMPDGGAYGPVTSKDLANILTYTVSCFAHLLTLLDVLDKARTRIEDTEGKNARLASQAEKLSQQLEILTRKLSEYEPALRYVKVFAEEKEREEAEKQKWR